MLLGTRLTEAGYRLQLIEKMSIIVTENAQTEFLRSHKQTSTEQTHI